MGGEKKKERAREGERCVVFFPSLTHPPSLARCSSTLPFPGVVHYWYGTNDVLRGHREMLCEKRKAQEGKSVPTERRRKKTQSVPLLFAVVEKGVCLCVCNSSQVSGSGVHETTQDTAACPLGLCLCRGVCFCRSPLHSLVRDNKGDEGFTQSLCPAIANF